MLCNALAQARDDTAAGKSAESIPDASASKDAIVDAATKNVFAQMDGDRKTTALKSLQVCALLLTGCDCTATCMFPMAASILVIMHSASHMTHLPDVRTCVHVSAI